MAEIVIADDDPVLRQALADGLRGSGHVVTQTDDGAMALELVRSRRPDLLLLDLALPGLTGFEVLEALRYDPAGTRLRIVVLSTRGDAEARLEAFEGGASEFLLTTREPRDLVAQIESFLAEPATIADDAG